MIAGFAAGALADKVGVRNMATAGPIVAMLAVIGLSQLTKTASGPMIGGLLFLAGLGCGLFQSPNGMANILSVKPSDRGVASSISILTLMFCSMVGIVVTFSFVLNSMDQATLFKLFIYGGASLPDAAVQSCLDALRKDWYIVIAACLAGAACASQIPHDFSAASAQARATAGDKPAEAAVADGAAADAAALAKGKAGVEDGGGAGDEAAPPTIVEFVAGAPFATDAEPPAADEPAPAAAATAEEPTAASA